MNSTVRNTTTTTKTLSPTAVMPKDENFLVYWFVHYGQELRTLGKYVFVIVWILFFFSLILFICLYLYYDRQKRIRRKRIHDLIRQN